MRDASFTLYPELRGSAPPPFAYRLEPIRPIARSWSIRDGLDREVGEARTRAGARAGVRALYQLDAHLRGDDARVDQPA